MESITIRNREIGPKQPCYIIAEMSANHLQDFDKAIHIIHKAKASGADCIKVQNYLPETLTLDIHNDFFDIKEGTWKGENLFGLYKRAFMPWDWTLKLKEEAERIGLDFFSTAYDKSAVDFLESIDIDFYKIASFELVDIPLIKYIASKQKPIILSTGLGTLGEIEEAIKAIREMGNDQICLLKCSSAYPAVPEEMNVATMNHLRETFNCPVGLSDHSLGSTSSVVAVALGANVIEKHICIDRALGGPDASFSMMPNEFKVMVDQIRIAEKAVGIISYNLSEREQINRNFRKSIFVSQTIKKGELFSSENLRIIRPGYGLPPRNWSECIGKMASHDIEAGQPLKWEDII